MTLSKALFCIGFALVGCTAEPVQVDCTASKIAVTGAVTSQIPTMPVSTDLDVQGTATDTDNLTIHRITVAGIEATNGGFNFDRWSVHLPFQLISTLARDASGVATVHVAAFDVCDQQENIATFMLPIAQPAPAP